jgi:hypothetical protein
LSAGDWSKLQYLTVGDTMKSDKKLDLKKEKKRRKKEIIIESTSTSFFFLGESLQQRKQHVRRQVPQRNGIFDFTHF